METNTDTAQLDRVFQALADGQRRAMVDRLSRGPASVKELAQPASMALPSALKHLAVLESAGLVLSEKVGRVRTFRIQSAALADIENWVATRKLNLNSAFDRLDAAMAAFPEEQP